MPLGAPDLEDMVRRKVADAKRDLFRSYAREREWGIEAGAS